MLSITSQLHPELKISFGGIEEGNVDPRPKFDTSEEEVMSARHLLRRAVGLDDSDTVYAMMLKGGTELVDLDAPVDDSLIMANGTYSEIDVVCDAVITTNKREGLIMGGADCIPLVLFEPQTNVLALVHLGWKGAVGRLHEKVLEYAKDQYGLAESNAIAYLGPAVSQHNFKTDKLHDAQANEDEWEPHIDERDDGFYIDIAGFVVSGLERVGIDSRRIGQSDIDTAAPKSNMFSHERHKKEGVRAGRNGFIVANF